MSALDQPSLDLAASIADPVERATALTRLLSEYQALSNHAARLRREAIDTALSSGVTQEHLAKRLGVTPGRVSQMRKAAADSATPIVTGWATGPGPPVAQVAICGSRAAGTNSEQLDAAVPALAELLMRQRYAVSHGPVGIGAEVLTYIADQYHPAGLDSVRGIVGHANVVRDAGYVLLVGGGSGSKAEADTAIAASKRVLPMPASGGTAALVYIRLLAEPALRAWLPDDTLAALATADASRFAALAETAIATGGDHA